MGVFRFKNQAHVLFILRSKALLLLSYPSSGIPPHFVGATCRKLKFLERIHGGRRCSAENVNKRWVGVRSRRVVPFWRSVVQVIPIFFPNTTGPSSFIHIIFYIFRIVQELLCRYHSSGILIQNHFFKHLILLRAFYSHHNCSLQMHTYQPAPPQSFVCGIRRDKTFKSALLFNLSWASFLGRTEFWICFHSYNPLIVQELVI